MSERKNLFINTITITTGTVISKGMQFIMIFFFSRWLSTEDYGTFDVLQTYVTLLIPIVGLATNEAMFRFSIDSDDADEKSVFITNCLVVFMIGTAMLLCIISVLEFAYAWEFGLLFFVFAAGGIFEQYFREYLRAIKKIPLYSMFNIVTTGSTIILVTLFVRCFGMGLLGMVLGYGIGYLISIVFIAVLTRYWDYVSIKCISVKCIKRLLAYSYPLIPNAIAWWFINVSDRTIINIFLGATFNGIYAVAAKIPNIVGTLFSTFNIPWAQAASESVNDSDRNEYYNYVYNKVLVVVLSLSCVILSCNYWIFRYTLDKRYYSGRVYVPILICGAVLAAMSCFCGSIQIGFKRPGENGVTTIIGAAVNIAVHLILIKSIGLYAAAISTAVSQMVVFISRKWRLMKEVNLKVGAKTAGVAAYFVVSVILAFGVENHVVNVVFVVVTIAFAVFINRKSLCEVLRTMKSAGTYGG